MKKSLINIIFSFLFFFSCSKNPGEPPEEGCGELLTDGFNLPVNTIFLTQAGDVLYNVPTDFAGVQFKVNGAAVSSASGGELSANNWTLVTSGTTVLGFTLSYTAITNDCGVLLILSLDGDATGISEIVFSDLNAQIIDVSYYEE